jgi:hypothetical protein
MRFIFSKPACYKKLDLGQPLRQSMLILYLSHGRAATKTRVEFPHGTSMRHIEALYNQPCTATLIDHNPPLADCV